MKLSQLAKALGRRGGVARAKRLSVEERKRIASLGGQVKAMSARAAERIGKNFKYMKAVKEFRRTPRPKSISRVDYPLPRIYDSGK